MGVKTLFVTGSLVAGLFVQAIAGVEAQAKNNSGALPVRVLLDPGHGGIDGGAVKGKVVEKDIVLDIGLRTKAALSRQGIVVKMTRAEDTDLSSRYPSKLSSRHKRDLQNRLHMMREEYPDLFISIHVNSSTQPKDRGPLVFYPVDSVAGKTFATIVQASLNQVAGSTQRPVGRKNLFLLRHSICPTVLVETGFVTNPSDLARLSDQVYREKIANAIALAVVTYSASP